MTVQRIACIGECMIELSDIGDSCYKRSFAGDTLNTSVYMARSLAGSEVQVSYVTALGTDSMSDAMLKSWQEEGINTDNVARIEDKTPGLYAIAVDEQGERSFSYWRSDSAAKQMLTISGLNKQQKTALIQDYGILYLSGITLAILDQPSREELFSLLEQARSNGAKVAFDSNYRPKLWASREEAKTVNQRILAITDIAMVTYDDEQLLFGDTALEQTMARFTHVPEVVIKNGADGCIITMANLEELVLSTVVSNVVDTTSAGDSFNGAYLAARLQNMSPKESALRAHRMAGAVIQYKGAIIPKPVTDQLIKENGK